MQRDRFYELDILRFIAAMSVVLFHYTFRWHAADSVEMPSFPALEKLCQYGYLGVDLFFIISGFVILLTVYGKNPTEFVISRITRLYPAFVASASLTAIATIFLGDDEFRVSLVQYLINLTMVGDLLGAKFIDGVYWSLVVELKFYFLIFLIIIFRQLKRIQILLGIWVILALITTAFNVPLRIGFILFPKWAAYFIAGATFYLTYTEGVGRWKVIIIALSYCLAILNALDIVALRETNFRVDFSETAVIVIITSFYTMFFLIALRKTTFLKSKSLVKFGALTYPLYLTHQKIGYMLFNHLGNYLNNYLNKYLLLILIVGLMLLTAYVINLYVERKLAKPFKSLLTSFVAHCFSRGKRGE